MVKVVALSLGISCVPVVATTGFSTAAWRRRGDGSALRRASPKDATTGSTPPQLFRDLYSILGVSRTAPAADIKAAYRKLAKRYHPDANPGRDTAREFQAINRAYELLFDVEKRKKYDSTLSAKDGGRRSSTVDFVYGNSPPPPTTIATTTTVGGGGGNDSNNNAAAARRPFQRSSTVDFRKPHASPPSANTPEYYKTVINNFNNNNSKRPPPPKSSVSTTNPTPTTTTTTRTNVDNAINKEIEARAARMKAKKLDTTDDFIKTKTSSSTSTTSPLTSNGNGCSNSRGATTTTTTTTIKDNNVYRHPFQQSSTDQFRKPHVTPPSANTPEYYKTVISNFNIHGQVGVGGSGVTTNNVQKKTTTTTVRSSSTPIPPIPKAQPKRQRATTTTTTTTSKPITTQIPKAEAPPRGSQLRNTSWNVGHVFDSIRSKPKPKVDTTVTTSSSSSSSSSSRTIKINNDNGVDIDKDDALDTRPYSQRPTPSYSSSNSRPITTTIPIIENTTPLPIAVTTPEEYEMQNWDKKLVTAQILSTKMSGLRHSTISNIQWQIDPTDDAPNYPILTMRVATIVFTTLMTRYLHLFRNNSPILSASVTTLLVSTCLDIRLGRAALCGSLAGMSGGHLTPTLSMGVALAGVTSLMYELSIESNNWWRGFGGGRLGVVTFLATSILAEYQGVHYIGRKLRRGLWRAGVGPSNMLVSMIGFHILGAIATLVLRESSDDSAAADPVRASSVIGLLGSLFLKDPTAVLAVYGGSFVGMSLPSRLIHGNSSSGQRLQQSQTPLSLFGSFAGAGALAGVFHAVTIRHGYWNGGWGGKAGMCAFVGCWTYRGLANTVEYLRTMTAKRGQNR